MKINEKGELDQTGAGREKLKLVYILEIKLLEFADGLDMGGGGEGKTKLKH